jgi:iron complex outermembrane receptor protein
MRFGGGGVARSLRQGDNQGSFQLPGYATIGLMAGDDTQLFGQKVKFQFNVDNLADTRYYNSWGWRNGVYAGAPRSFRGSVRVEF